MRWRVVIGNLGNILRLFSFTLLVPMLLGLVFEPRTVEAPWGFSVAGTTYAFLSTFVATFALGFALERVGLASEFRDKEAYVLVGIGWLSVTLVAAVPYLLTGVIENPSHAFFEAMSGLTTTGASVLTPPLEPPNIPEGVHVWRALTQWLGGMGIVVLTVAVLSRLASAGARLMQAEVPGGRVQRVRPSIVQTARALFKVYATFSLILFGLLLALFYVDLGSPLEALLNAVVHTFTTMSTGGFSTQSASIQSFEAPLVEAVIIVFMIIAGTNFALFHRTFKTDPRALFRDDEFRFYLAILGTGVLLITGVLLFAGPDADLWADHGGFSFLTALRLAVFQTVSIVTTTGYSTANFDAWPEAARFLLLFAMFIGGMVGSTGGSIKVARALVLFRTLKAELRRIAHPRAVLPIRLGREALSSQVVTRVAVFIFAYLTLFLGGVVALLLLEPVSVLDGVSAVAASIGNIGPGLGVVGPASNYHALGDASTVVLALLMWVGRLELFAVLVLFSPETYE